MPSIEPRILDLKVRTAVYTIQYPEILRVFSVLLIAVPGLTYRILTVILPVVDIRSTFCFSADNLLYSLPLVASVQPVCASVLAPRGCGLQITAVRTRPAALSIQHELLRLADAARNGQFCRTDHFFMVSYFIVDLSLLSYCFTINCLLINLFIYLFINLLLLKPHRG